MNVLGMIKSASEEDEPSDHESNSEIFSDIESNSGNENNNENKKDNNNDNIMFQSENNFDEESDSSNLTEILQPVHNSSEEDETSEDDSDDGEIEKKKNQGYISSSGTRWKQLCEIGRAGREPKRNIFKGKPGVCIGIHPETPSEAFLMYFDEIIDESKRFTNLEGQRQT